MRDSVPPEALVECPSCGAAVERGAQVCFICGSLLGAGARSKGLSVETCRIERWRGYVASTFYAASADGVVLSESKPIRSRGAAPPAEKPKARAAFDEVVAGLLAQGWEPTGPAGPEWYAKRYSRRVQQEAVKGPAPVVGLNLPAVPRYQPPAPSLPALPPARPVAKSSVQEEPPSLPPGRESPAPASSLARRRWTRFLLGVIAAGAVAAVGVAVFVHRGARATPPAAHVDVPKAVAVARPRVVAARPSEAKAPAALKPAATVAVTHRHHTAAPPVRHVVDLRVVAVSGPSWVDIRRGSATGGVLYRSTLLKGQHIGFAAPSIWVSFGAASALSITVDGKRYGAFGTMTHTFSASAQAPSG
jgi:hypothetical protein